MSMDRIVRVALSLLWTEVGVRGGWHQVKVTHRQWAVGGGGYPRSVSLYGRLLSPVLYTDSGTADKWIRRKENSKGELRGLEKVRGWVCPRGMLTDLGWT